MTVPGIGVINTIAIISAIGNGSQFANGREFAVWLGLTARQASSGDTFKSSGITKRGNGYLRKQLIHGARAVLFRCKKKTDQLSRWVNQLVARRGVQKACVALASLLARLRGYCCTGREATKRCRNKQLSSTHQGKQS